ncbi:hypothetical protein J2Z21_003338 [Streptomyces griseochromogenes]|uniref:ATP-binding protein n=1 Tax=Streptomyces griseochromogenes TaxID=68214 RepID=A0A1B1B8L4_9ACTN|nr:hypothetical protein [Streptomyces griseochromogenes]ANP55165.1 hypothetical protein AVL59_41240 [Streptomyces griseochromogenes]MBP2050399.1 hypothetical protein [Streptomyces griseochromogenes]
MKSLKAAAVLVGALALAGTAAPALAADAPAQGILDDGKAIAHTLPNATDLPTGALASDVRHTADGVKRSGVVKTPVFGGTLPNPLNGKAPAKLPAVK